MKLSRKSWLFRWAYQADVWRPAKQVNLCSLFWRAFCLMPLAYAALALVVGVGLYGLLWRSFVMYGWLGLLIIPTFVLGICFFVLVSNWVRAKKDRYCPIITLED